MKKKEKTPREMAIELEVMMQLKETYEGLADMADRILKSMGKDFRKGSLSQRKLDDLATLSNAHNVAKALHESASENLWK